MAPRLQNQKTSATVVKLAPRKAKGAGGQKRSSKPPARMKTPEHAQPPKAAPALAAQPSDAQTRQAVQDRLVALHHNHEQAQAKILIAQEAMSELKTKKAEIRAAIQNTCIPLGIYDEVLKKLRAKTKRIDNEAYEKQRALAFEAFGLPCGPAPELDLTGKMPEPAKAATYWEETGYQVAVGGAGQFADPQRDGVPPENVQDYMKGHARGTEMIGRGIKALETQPAKSPEPPPPLMVGEDPEKAAAKAAAQVSDKIGQLEQPDWTGYDDDPDMWSDEQRETFLAWFKALPEDADIDIQHVGVAKAFDEAVDAEEAAAPPSVH